MYFLVILLTTTVYVNTCTFCTYHAVLLCIAALKAILSFESVDVILKCADHEHHSALVSLVILCKVVL